MDNNKREFIFVSGLRELNYIQNTIQNTGNFIARLEKNCSRQLLKEIAKKMLNCGLCHDTVNFHFEVKIVYDKNNGFDWDKYKNGK